MSKVEKGKFDQLDEHSKDFIRWNFEQLNNDNTLIDLIYEVTDAAREWLFRNHGTVRERLFSKMVKGAMEHGAPIHPVGEVDQELEGEYLDLIGWTQVRRYNEKRLSEDITS